MRKTSQAALAGLILASLLLRVVPGELFALYTVVTPPYPTQEETTSLAPNAITEQLSLWQAPATLPPTGSRTHLLAIIVMIGLLVALGVRCTRLVVIPFCIAEACWTSAVRTRGP